MKTTTLILIVLIFGTTTLFAQAQQKKEQEQEQSNAEKFSTKTGTLLEKEFVKIGEVKEAQISVVYYTDLINNTKDKAVKFEHGSANTAVLDADEIDGLIKSIKLIQEKIFPTQTTNYIEVTFRSRSGFEAGCYWHEGNWSTYLKFSYTSNPYVFLTKDDFPTLLNLLEQAKAKLQ